MKNNLCATVGINIKILRHIKGMTITDLCEKTKLSSQTILPIEKGTANPTLITLHKIARALNVNVSTLFLEQALMEIYAEEEIDE